MKKRITAALLILVMVISMTSNIPAFATGTHDPSCPYQAGTPCGHTTHTDACGYVEAVAGAACSHINNHDSACGYAPAVSCEPCQHTVHTDVCGYREAVEGVECKHNCTELAGACLICSNPECRTFYDGPHAADCLPPYSYNCGHAVNGHNTDCGYRETIPGSPCSHTQGTHDNVCGYVAPVDEKPCQHTVHTDACGYREAVPGSPCSHTQGTHDTACGFAEEIPCDCGGHVHVYATTAGHKDVEGHWFYCTVTDCLGFYFEEHNYSYGVCTVCGYGTHQHEWNTEWNSDSTHHWNTCKDSTCTVKGSEGEHNNGTDYICDTCGYDSIPPHTHNWKTDWSSDENGHWYACADSTCTEKNSYATHSKSYGICTACGYGTHQHEWNTEWNSGCTHHWNTCKDSTCSVKGNKGEHNWGADARCRTCGWNSLGRTSHLGGTATCIAKAVCTHCGDEYGEPDAKAHHMVDGVCTLCSGNLRMIDNSFEGGSVRFESINAEVNEDLVLDIGYIEGFEGFVGNVADLPLPGKEDDSIADKMFDFFEKFKMELPKLEMPDIKLRKHYAFNAFIGDIEVTDMLSYTIILEGKTQTIQTGDVVSIDGKEYYVLVHGEKDKGLLGANVTLFRKDGDFKNNLVIVDGMRAMAFYSLDATMSDLQTIYVDGVMYSGFYIEGSNTQWWFLCDESTGVIIGYLRYELGLRDTRVLTEARFSSGYTPEEMTAKENGTYLSTTDGKLVSTSVAWAGDISLLDTNGAAAQASGSLNISLPAEAFAKYGVDTKYVAAHIGENGIDYGELNFDDDGGAIATFADIDDFSPFIILAITEHTVPEVEPIVLDVEVNTDEPTTPEETDKVTDNPQTGDNSRTALWITLAASGIALFVIALIVLAVIGKKKKAI